MAHGDRQFAGAAHATSTTASMTAGSPANGATFSVNDATGWPTANFVCVLDRGLASEEKLFIASRSGTTLTIGNGTPGGRGFDGTAAASHNSGASCEHLLDADILTKLLEHVNTDAAFDHAGYLQKVAHKGATGDISASAPGDAKAAGNSGKYSDAAHVHQREAAAGSLGIVYQTNLGTALSQTVTSEADVTGLTSITFTADGTSRYRLHLHCVVYINSAGGFITIRAKESSTLLGIIFILGGLSAAAQATCDGFWEWVPSAGSHTFKITAACTGSGGGRIDTSQVSGQDTYLSVEKVT